MPCDNQYITYVRTGFVEYADYKKLYAELQENLRVTLTIRFHTGLRSQEVFGLIWKSVNLTESAAVGSFSKGFPNHPTAHADKADIRTLSQEIALQLLCIAFIVPCDESL